MDKKDVKKDHQVIKAYVSRILKYIESNKINLEKIKQDFKDLTLLWDTHEQKEDTLVTNLKNKSTQMIEKMPLDHPELRGHNQVIIQALKSKDPNKVLVALDTDGRMFLDKLVSHMAYEENLILK